jgi:hypothetical protein
VVLAILSVLTIGTILALYPTVVQPTVAFFEVTGDFNSPPVLNWSPKGYTLSLALFGLPMLVLLDWLMKHPELTSARKAAGITMAIVLPTWVALDVFLGLTFFEFPNYHAILGDSFEGKWHFWGLELQRGQSHASSLLSPGGEGREHMGFGWPRAIPIEEIGFYVFGIAAILLSYVWASESFLKQYSTCDQCRRNDTESKGIHWKSLWTAAFLFAGAMIYKKFGPHPYHDGFPGYFLFLLLSSLLPAMLCYSLVKRFVNWRAMTVSLLWLLLVSLLWEVTLALPQGWWSYESEQMVGLMINAWHGLPIEEPILWAAAAWINILGYELVRLLIAKKVRVRDFRLHHVREGIGASGGV